MYHLEKKKKRNFHSQSDKEYEPEHTNHSLFSSRKEVVVESLSHVQLFVTPWTAASQASLSFTISWSLLKLMSIESVMPSNHLILCFLLLLLPSIFPSIRECKPNQKKKRKKGQEKKNKVFLQYHQALPKE